MKKRIIVLLLFLVLFAFACSPKPQTEPQTKLVVDDFSFIRQPPEYAYKAFGQGAVNKTIEQDSEFNTTLKLSFTPFQYKNSVFVPFARFILHAAPRNVWGHYNYLNFYVKSSTSHITLILLLYEKSAGEQTKPEVWQYWIASGNFEPNVFKHVKIPLNQSSFTLREDTATDRKLDFTKITSLQMLIKTFEVNKTENVWLAKMYLSKD